jgi:hypothetical protein
MPVTSKILESVLRVTIDGDYAMEELVQAIAEGFRDRRSTPVTLVLLDARHSMANPSEDAIRKASREIRELQPGEYSRWAMVIGLGPMRFRIARMASIAMENLGIQMKAFTDLEDANRWLLSNPVIRPSQGHRADSRI